MHAQVGVCPDPVSVAFIAAIVTGICTVLAAIGTLVAQLRSNRKADERHAAAEHARALIRDDVASIVQAGECEVRRAARDKSGPGNASG